MKIEKKNKMDQLYFGKVTALQPKIYRKDQGSKGCPLFEQQPEEDPNQVNLFEPEKPEAKKQKVNIFRVNHTLKPENIGTIEAATPEELKRNFIYFLDCLLGKDDYLLKPDTTIIKIYAKKKDYNYYILN